MTTPPNSIRQIEERDRPLLFDAFLDAEYAEMVQEGEREKIALDWGEELRGGCWRIVGKEGGILP